jgi:hypothetical protein
LDPVDSSLLEVDLEVEASVEVHLVAVDLVVSVEVVLVEVVPVEVGKFNV